MMAPPAMMPSRKGAFISERYLMYWSFRSELDRAISAGGYRLRAGAGEPIDDGATRDDAEQEGCVHQRKVLDVLVLQAVGERNDGGESHRRGADHRGADQHRLGSGLKGVARAVVLFQVLLGFFEVRFESEVRLKILGDTGQGLDHRQLVDRLRVVGDWAVAIH